MSNPSPIKVFITGAANGLAEVREGLADHPEVELVGTAAEPLWSVLSEFKRQPEATLSLKANLLPHAVAGFCRMADGLDDCSGSSPWSMKT